MPELGRDPVRAAVDVAVDHEGTADAGAERQQHEAMKLLAGARPKLAVGRRVGVIRESDRHAQMVAHAVADRKIPPARQVAGPQDHALGDVHRSRRGDARADDVVGVDFLLFEEVCTSVSEWGSLSSSGFNLIESLEEALPTLCKKFLIDLS